MEVKHQVFVSSTYKDLIEERKQVIHALLELDCIPAGMELFPATDEDAWSLIKEVIDGCDYYILIMGGKYGSTNTEGISFTEIEYDYAILTEKPVIAFLHENIETLPGARIEKTEENQSKLKAFREKAEKKHCKYWNTPEDLGGKVSRSLVQLKKKHPSDGWVPGRFAADEKMLRETEELRRRITQLEYEAITCKDTPPPGIELLEQGHDAFPINFNLKKTATGKEELMPISITWDELFSYAGSALIGECTEKEFEKKLKLAYWHQLSEDMTCHNQFDNIIIPYVGTDQIKIQFQALGLMAPGVKKRPVSDKNTYWKLTRYGEKYLISVKALRKTANALAESSTLNV